MVEVSAAWGSLRDYQPSGERLVCGLSELGFSAIRRRILFHLIEMAGADILLEASISLSLGN